LFPQKLLVYQLLIIKKEFKSDKNKTSQENIELYKKNKELEAKYLLLSFTLYQLEIFLLLYLTRTKDSTLENPSNKLMTIISSMVEIIPVYNNHTNLIFFYIFLLGANNMILANNEHHVLANNLHAQSHGGGMGNFANYQKNKALVSGSNPSGITKKDFNDSTKTQNQITSSNGNTANLNKKMNVGLNEKVG